MSTDLAAQVGELYPPDHSRRNAAILAVASIFVGLAGYLAVESHRRPQPALHATAPAVVSPRSYVPSPRVGFAPYSLAASPFTIPAAYIDPPPHFPPPHRGAPAFDRGAAAASLGSVNVRACRKDDGPVGSGHVSITFANDGSVASATVDSGPFPGTAVGTCVAGKFSRARIPPFAGAPVRVGKSFSID